MPTTTYAFDLQRIFFGNLPWEYALEIVFRTAIIYVYALFIVRLLGKRGMGQLAPFDFIIIIALGSAVGDPMFYPNVPILHAIAAITCIVLFTRILVRQTMRSRKLRNFVSAEPSRLIVDGVLQLRQIHAERLSPSEVFEALRTSGVRQLGQVERCYLEPSGRMSVFQYPPEQAPDGIPVTPSTGSSGPPTFEMGEAAPKGRFGCTQCGTALDFQANDLYPPCPNCGGECWVKTVRHQLR